MGNEASLEAAGQPPQSPGPVVPQPGIAVKTTSAPSGGQLPGPNCSSVSGKMEHSERLAGHRAVPQSPKQVTQGHEATQEKKSHIRSQQQGDNTMRTLQVENRIQRSRRSPSASPDRGNSPTSPYSVPQIAPLPSSTLCPICNTTDLTSSPNQPNFNTCTQCHNDVCKQCGFNPNPHLTEVNEWLCLNCQMQRALGMDMTTATRSKSQQQLHSPSLSPSHSSAKQSQTQPEPKLQSQQQFQPQSNVPPQLQLRAKAENEKPLGAKQSSIKKGTNILSSPQTKAQLTSEKEQFDQSLPKSISHPQEVVKSYPRHQQGKPSSLDQGKNVGDSVTTSPTLSCTATQDEMQEGLTGKLFGFGASLLNQASTLISVQPEPTPQSHHSPGKVPPKIVFTDVSKEGGSKHHGTIPGILSKAGSVKQGQLEKSIKTKDILKDRTTCPLCKTEINVGSGEPSNYKTCTACEKQVCNMCGFNPTPHLVEKNEWLCLNCQTQRLLEGSLGDAQTPMTLPTPKHQATGSTWHQQESINQQQQSVTETPQDRHLSEGKPFMISEQSKVQPNREGKKPSVTPFQDKLQSKTPADSPMDEKPMVAKGKSIGTRRDTTIKEGKASTEIQRDQEETNKTCHHDLSRSPQSLSDTGYSSDGISSSQSEITGLVQQEEEQLNETGNIGCSPPSPSEIIKLESSVRPLLESKGMSQTQSHRGKIYHELREEQKHKQRPRSLSITPETFDSDEELEDIMEEDEDSLEWENQKGQMANLESSDDFGSKLRHDYVEDSSEEGFSPLPTKQRRGEFTDEEFMRRQILEMSAEEDNLVDEEENVSIKYNSVKSSHKLDSEKGKDSSSSKRRLPQNSSGIYEEDRKGVEAVEEEEMAHIGLRRFKTIELNSTNNYNRDMELSHETDLSLDREPELEMESLTGSPDEKSRGEYSSTLPATTPSYTSGTSPTSISSLEEDSDSSPSRRQRLEEVKQQRKARHRSHGPLLPTIEDSSEEEELREEEELLREQEKMREVEQQRIRSTARKTKRDKEELRAQRRRERSKTPPSNLSPIEDASPTEELRQAAEMEELHRSSCSEYSPSIDSEAEGFDIIASKLYKSGSEYNLPTFMSLYSPTEKMSTYHSNKPLKSAEEVYEEMMRKAEMFQKQVQQSLQNVSYNNFYQEEGYGNVESQNNFEYQFIDEYSYDTIHMTSSQTDYQNEIAKPGAIYEEILQTSQNISRMHQSSSLDLSLQQEEKTNDQENAYQEKQFLNTESAYSDVIKQTGGPLTPGTSPTQLAAPVSFPSSESSGGRAIPDVQVTQHFSKEGHDHSKFHNLPAAPSSGSKVMTTSYQYSKGCNTGTSVTSPHQIFTINASNASSVSNVSAISSTSGSYGQPKTTPSYILDKDLSKHKSVAEISETIEDKFQNNIDSVTGTSLTSKVTSFFKSSSPPLSPTSPTQSPTQSAPRIGIPGSSGSRAKSTAEFSTQTQSARILCDLLSTSAVSTSSLMIAQGTQTPHQSGISRLSRQQSSQEAPFMVITLASNVSSQTKSIDVTSSIPHTISPTRVSDQQTSHSYCQTVGSTAKNQQEQPSSSHIKTQTIIGKNPTSTSGQMHAAKGHISIVDTSASTHSWGALPAENISLCRISSVPGTSRVEPGPKLQIGSAVDLRTALKPAPVIITDQGMDLTSLATETRRYSLTLDQSPTRQSTTVQPLIINLSAQEQPHAIIGTATTVSITIASSMLVSQPKQPIVYGDPFQHRVDLGQGVGSPVCLTQIRQMEQAGHSGILRGNMNYTGISANERKTDDAISQQTIFARYNLPNQMTSLVKKDMLIAQTSKAPNIVSISTIPKQLKQNQTVGPSEIYRQFPVELRTQNPPVNLINQPSHAMMVQLDDMETGTVTKLVKEETPSNSLDLTGMKPENQMVCCDVVYKFPFGSSCTGTFIPSPKMPEKNVGDTIHISRSSSQYYVNKDDELSETYPYKESSSAAPNIYEEHKLYPQGLSGRLHSSMSENNLSEIALNYYSAKSEQPFQSSAGDCAMDLTTMKNSYTFTDGGCLGQGFQYGSFTDLRQPTDLLIHSLPMRRYSSMSNIYSDYRYTSRDLTNLQESSLAQYSATTAREISRMCAALNSMDQYGGRHANSPDLLQYGPSSISAGPTGSSVISGQQGLSSVKTNMIYNSNFVDTCHGYGNLAQYNVSGPQIGAVRHLYPSTATVRAADGMIYSTINTPIASTLPITTQPASVLRPMFQGLYSPLASLTRVPLVAPRIPLAPQVLYRSSAPSRFMTVTTASLMEVPMYLGKPINTLNVSTTANIVSKGPAVSALAPTQVIVQRPEETNVGTREDFCTVASGMQSASKEISQHQQQPNQKQQTEAQQTLLASKVSTEKEEKEKEEDRQRKQQEHMLQIERERVELEKLRQLRLHEELERERIELQRHREKEQILVQREIQELQSIKQQVLQQQQEERQAQFAMQREQLVQQRIQLEQIQQLQQQLQQQLEEQKRQKTAIPPASDSATRISSQAVSEIAIEMQRTLAQNGQYWPPMNQPFIAMAATGQETQPQPRCLVPQRPLINSISEMSLQTEEHWEGNRSIKKRNSMPWLKDAYDIDEGHDSYIVKKITNSSVQTDDEDGEDKYYMSRRRRTRRSTDCSVQTDDEDDWEQPVRRRRSRFSRHSDSGSDGKHDSSKGTSSIAIQTISDCSVQTEPDQLQRVSPSIHITTPDPKVEIVKYISAPEKTRHGESLACQTEPETQPQGMVVPQFTLPTTKTSYTANIQITASGPLDPNHMRQQATTKFEKKKPDPLEIGYHSQLPTDSLSQLVPCQPPKSPQVLYSPVSPLSSHRLLESTFTSTERLNKAHVTPQKHFTAESIQHHQTLPRPIKTIQRSLSDPKPISPTSEETGKDKFSIYQHQLLQNSQISALQSNTLTRKVKRTLPSPPPDEGHLPLASQAHSQMYMPSLTERTTASQAILAPKVVFLKTIDRDIKIVEQESTKLRKQQAELDEEEKEIDAKLKYLELGITQRKESLTKDKGPSKQDFSYLKCLGENRDYMSDSELNNIRISSYGGSSLLTKPSTTPFSQYSEFSAPQQFPTTTSSYSSSAYQYPVGKTVSQGTATFQYTKFQSPHYPVSSNGASQNGFQAHQVSAYPFNVPQSTGYQSELGLQNHASFQPPNQYPIQTTYQSQLSVQPAPNSLFQSQTDTFSAHQKPRQTTLADLEQKIHTNYEVITNPAVVISSTTPEAACSSSVVPSSYDQYKTSETRPTDRGNAIESPSSSYCSEALYTNLEQNIPRNYVMIEDINELTKENAPSAEAPKVELQPPQSSNGRHIKENGLLENDASNKPCCYSRSEEESEEDIYDHHSSDHRGKNSYHRSLENNGRVSGSPSSSSYYYGDNDYKHSSRPEKHGSSTGMQKHSSKNLAPAVVSSKRSKHRKQGIEQKISKFSPIEEAKDVESDLASYPVTTSVSNSISVTSKTKTFQDDITYGLKKNVYEQQKYYGLSSRDIVEDGYSSGSRSRSASSYASDRSNRDIITSRSKSYERENAQKTFSKPSTLNMSHSRGRAPIRLQASEEESPVSPIAKTVGISHSSGGSLPQTTTESCPPFCSSHSLPDVQEHVKEVPRTHSYKQEETYSMDDSHCVVSDSEAYHLGQEETDWFDKPREARSERSRYYSAHSSSSQKKTSMKHTYHDYDEPPNEDLWQHDDYSQPRHASSKEHRHHGEPGRHSSSSRHPNDESRRSKQYPRDQGRHESRPHSQSSSQKKAQQSEIRTQPAIFSNSSDYSQQPRQSSNYHHTLEAQKTQKQTQSVPSSQQHKSESQSHQPQQVMKQQQPEQQQQQLSSRQQIQQSARQQQVGSSQHGLHQQQPTHPQSTQPQGSLQQQPSHHQTTHQQGSQHVSQQQTKTQQQQQGQSSSRPQQQQIAQPQQAEKQQQIIQPQVATHQIGVPKADHMDSPKPAMKTAQQGRAPQAQPHGTATAGIKLGQKPVGTTASAGAAPGLSGQEGESMFSKILPGSAAEQAGKLTDAVSAFGKKFTSFW